jgi:hypothetical protein
MILGEPTYHLGKSHQARSGEHSGLAHVSPDLLSPAACLLNESSFTDHKGADRATQALRETKGNAVDVLH